MSDTVDRERLQSFRSQTRTWLDANCPEFCRGPQTPDKRVYAGKNMQFPTEDSRLWYQRMVEKGWCMPGYPVEYGGGGLSPEECQILKEEMAALGCCEPQINFGITMVAPVILKFGTEEQKREFLPKIAKGELRWCQGYSEPGSGSDLASLRTSAVSKGDYYVVNGSKIWTTDGDKADWMYCLTRTDPKAPKQKGISFLLFSMDQPGITPKPIKMISGDSHFCQVFLDDVRAEKAHRIGEENKGWTVAKYLLQHERALMSDLATASGGAISVLDTAGRCLHWENGQISDAALRDRMADHLINRAALDLVMRKVAEEAELGQMSLSGLGLKYSGSEEEKRRQTLLMDIFGSDALGWEDEENFPAQGLRCAIQWLNSRAYTIAGGSSEIQLNVIARHALGLSQESSQAKS